MHVVLCKTLAQIVVPNIPPAPVGFGGFGGCPRIACYGECLRVKLGPVGIEQAFNVIHLVRRVALLAFVVHPTETRDTTTSQECR